MTGHQATAGIHFPGREQERQRERRARGHAAGVLRWPHPTEDPTMLSRVVQLDVNATRRRASKALRSLLSLKLERSTI